MGSPLLTPPLLLTSEADSFARYTVKDRVPAILRETIALNAFPPSIATALEDLHTELVSGKIRGLREAAPDRAFWDAASQPFLDHTWLDVPWYWAEAYFYRRVLEATQYFRPGPWASFDPFAAKKAGEWQPSAAPAAASALLAALPEERTARLEALFHASLWGNRTDLSYEIAAGLGGTGAPHAERHNLLCDDTPAIIRYLSARPGARVAVLADNAGTELVTDLALMDDLLHAGWASAVHYHVKPQPFYVSDTLLADVMDALRVLAAAGAAAGALAGRIRDALRQGRLVLDTHWAYASSLQFFELPPDLLDALATFDLVLTKGDANYRRLVGDAHWPATTPFADTARYFPAPVAALRTLKSELIVGLPPGAAEHLAAEDPKWLVNGKRGVIQARLPVRNPAHAGA
jgi:hypothetical protein